jgi:plasmid stabilization system protein ParE
MAFSVEITDPARDDIDDSVAFIAQRSQPAARKWKTELQVLILSLQDMPGRFAVIPEAGELGMPYRSAPHHSHRVIFRIDEQKNTVYVVRVYHGARQPLTYEDIDLQDED